ncbi:PilW family protein [Collimonas arenae]|nr:PilW family protein [Collimonas arenae]
MPKLFNRPTAGFGLVEVMVSLAIGMIAVIIMLQVFALSEQRKRTTTGGGDAQSTAAIALNQLQSDVGQAGYGISAVGLFNCNLTWKLPSGTSIATAIPLAPVTVNPATSIIPAGDANTDTLLVVYGNTNGQPQGNPINAQASTVDTVQMPSAFAVGDRVIAAPAVCSANLVLDRITATAATTVTVGTGAAGSTLYNLGPTPSMLAYAIRGGNLTVCDYQANDCGLSANTSDPSIWAPIANNVVSMRAVYWRDTSAPMDGIPDANGHDQSTPTTACGWARLSAVGLVLVARSAQFEKGIVTATALNSPIPVNAPTWSENATASIIAATGTLGPNTAADEPWKHYRYKVFETVIPIRNVGWMGVTQGC